MHQRRDERKQDDERILSTAYGTSRANFQRHLPTSPKRLIELLSSHARSDEIWQQLNKKDQIKHLQIVLSQKQDEYAQVEQKIEQCKRDGEQLNDVLNDQIKEYSLQLARQSQLDPNTTSVSELTRKRDQLKKETIELHNYNKVLQFEIDVQQGLSMKLAASKQQSKRKIQMLDEYVKKTELKIRQKQPNLDLNEMPQAKKKKLKSQQQVIGIIEKTPDEILAEKNQLIEEYTKKIDQLTFQIQEITRTCILEKQELLKKIQDNKEEQVVLAEKILNLKLRISKNENLDQEQASDMEISQSMTKKLSKETEYSKNGLDVEQV